MKYSHPPSRSGHRWARRQPVASFALAVAASLGLGVTPAHADVIRSPHNSHRHASPDAYSCTAGWYFDVYSNQRHQWVTYQQGWQNNSGGNSTATIYNSTSHSFTWSVSVSVSASASAAIFAEIKASVDAAITYSTTTVVGSSASWTVPAHTTEYGALLIKSNQTYGKSYYLSQTCVATSVTYPTVKTPDPNTWAYGSTTPYGNS